MDFEKMSLNELKEHAKKTGILVGNTGKEKLIEKLKSVEEENKMMQSVIREETESIPNQPIANNEAEKKSNKNGLLDSIISVVDELDDSDKDNDITVEDLPIDTIIPVKSITFGGLTYKSKTNNAIFRWGNIGAIEHMSIAQLNEMNNTNREFLNKPLVILVDERAIRKFRLTKVYENVAKINDLKRVFASDEHTIKYTIDRALDANMRDVLISKISQMIKNKSLVDINIIRMLNAKLQYDFEELLAQVA